MTQTPRHWSVLTRLLANGKTTGLRIHDAKIAAVCLEHRVRELWTADSDFDGSVDLATRNPLLICSKLIASGNRRRND